MSREPLTRGQIVGMGLVMLVLLALTIWIWFEVLPPCPPGGSPEPCEWSAR